MKERNTLKCSLVYLLVQKGEHPIPIIACTRRDSIVLPWGAWCYKQIAPLLLPLVLTCFPLVVPVDALLYHPQRRDVLPRRPRDVDGLESAMLLSPYDLRPTLFLYLLPRKKSANRIACWDGLCHCSVFVGQVCMFSFDR